MKITITVNQTVLTAELNQSPTAQAIATALPLMGNANVWGEEIYFEIPLEIPLASDAVEEVDIGTLAYWPTGKALCIFFGPTPVSTGTNPRAYSPVNIFGRILSDSAKLKGVPDGALVKIERYN